MSGERVTIEGTSVPRWAWLTYRTLTWFCVFLFACALLLRWPGILHQYTYLIKRMLRIENLLPLFFLISCIYALTGRIGAAHWVRMSGVWLLALNWSDIPGIGRVAIERWMYGEPFDITGIARLTGSNAVIYWMFLGKVVDALVLVMLVVSSHVVCSSHERDRMISDSSARTESGKWGRLLGAGLVLMGLGIACCWPHYSLLAEFYLRIVGSYLLAGGVACLLLWHFQTRSSFRIGAPICASAIVLTHTAYISFATAVVVGLPWVSLGVRNLWCRRVSLRLRVTAIVVMVLFGVLAFPQSFLPCVGYLRFLPGPKPLTERPVDFPDYIRAPEGAYDVVYYSGKQPTLSFSIDTSYPASETTDSISRSLDEAGWQRLDYDLRGPLVESSHSRGWDHPRPVPEGEDERDVGEPCSFWNGQWVNDANDVVWVMLAGRPSDGTSPVTLRGSITWESSESARRWLDNYRIVRAEQEHQEQTEEPNSIEP